MTDHEIPAARDQEPLEWGAHPAAARLGRRALIKGGVGGAGLLLAGALAGCGSSASSTPLAAPTTMPVRSGDDALERLKAGNSRYMRGVSVGVGRDAVRRVQQAAKQTPFAIVVSCADSRVPPEIVFDEGIGDLFVVRVAGNTAASPLVQGSIEFAVSQLHSVLIMVLGHESCGAVQGALDVVNKGASLPGQIDAVVEPILPAARAVTSLPADQQLAAATRQNVVNQLELLKGLGPIVQEAVASGSVKLVGGEYVLKTGAVQLLEA
jgi:carbonic anhydrase